MTPAFSPFSYTLNNPVNFIDEFGLSGSGWNTRGRQETEAETANKEAMQKSEMQARTKEFIQKASQNSLSNSGMMPGADASSRPTLKQYKPDMADRWREGNILQQMVYGFADGIYGFTTRADYHLGGAQFESGNDRINTRLFGFMSLAGPISNIGKGAQVGKNLVSNIRFPVYRVFGNVSKQSGFSWTFINPKLFTTNFFRKIAGLPNVNSATSIVKGSAKIKDVKLLRRALPLDGNPGGLPELIIDPKNVRMKAPGDFKSYFKF